MAPWFGVTRVLTALNLALLLGLSYVWLGNYRRVSTSFTRGFVVFGGLLAVQNAYALYIYVLDPTTSEWFADIPERYTGAIMLLTLLQFGALVVLARITLE